MQTKPPYTYGGQAFRNLGEIKEHVKAFLDYYNRVIGEEKFDPVLADVVADRHYIWRHRGITPTSFMFMANDTDDGRRWSDSLAGYFGPEYGWQRFSYHKALMSKDPTMEQEFTRLCRERWGMVWRPKVFKGGTCEVTGCLDRATDADHEFPTHKRIVDACWALLSEEDRKQWWHNMVFSDGGTEHFQMPPLHPATVLYDEMTADCRFRHLCQRHHREATRGNLTFKGAVVIAPAVEAEVIDFDALFG